MEGSRPSHHSTFAAAIRAALAAAVALLAWAWSDILVWQRVMEANHVDHVVSIDRTYQAGHMVVLVGLVVVGMVMLWSRWSLWYGGATWTLAYSGLADVLYYVLDRRPVPAILPWLDSFHPLVLFHPATAGGLVLSSALWAALWLALLGLGLAGFPRRGWRSSLVCQVFVSRPRSLLHDR